MIECEKKFPTPEMLERIAIALEMDPPELFSTKFYPLLEHGTLSNFQEKMISDISQVIASHISEMKEIIQINEEKPEKK